MRSTAIRTPARPPRSGWPCAAACLRMPAKCASRPGERVAGVRPASLCRHRQMAWRPDRPGSKGPGAIGLGLGTPVDQPVSRAMDLSTSTYRSPDPHFVIVDRFVIRRVAANSRRSTSATMPARRCTSRYSVSWASISARSTPPTRPRRIRLERISMRCRPTGCAITPGTPRPRWRPTSGHGGCRPAAGEAAARVVAPAKRPVGR